MPRTLLFPALLVAALGCSHEGGRTTTPAPSPPPPPGGEQRGEQPGSDEAGGPTGELPLTEVSPASVCARIFELKAQHCGLVDGYGLTEDECVADYERSLGDRGDAAHEATLRAGHCLLDHDECADVSTCFDQFDDDANNGTPDQLRSCAQTDVYAPVGVSQADWDARKGAGAHFYREAASTKGDPVAVCGIPAEMDWLLQAKCDDGSDPYGGSFDRAHASRVGNVGPGGKCQSIIDLYDVPCPEGHYAVYIDAYVCPVAPGQPVPHD
ncbi:MAG TPA: hypothetical protein VHE35_37095 [Kofleriaceae bacterium]|nr:hypothetical protein [Kofleriaceae bacterium]